jgi:hypothetical protein
VTTAIQCLEELQDLKEGNNVYSNQKWLLENKMLICVGCTAHMLRNCMHHGTDVLDSDIKIIVFKNSSISTFSQ